MSDRTLQGLIAKLEELETFEDRLDRNVLELLEYIPLLKGTINHLEVLHAAIGVVSSAVLTPRAQTCQCGNACPPSPSWSWLGTPRHCLRCGKPIDEVET